MGEFGSEQVSGAPDTLLNISGQIEKCKKILSQIGTSTEEKIVKYLLGALMIELSDAVQMCEKQKGTGDFLLAKVDSLLSLLNSVNQFHSLDPQFVEMLQTRVQNVAARERERLKIGMKMLSSIPESISFQLNVMRKLIEEMAKTNVKLPFSRKTLFLRKQQFQQLVKAAAGNFVSFQEPDKSPLAELMESFKVILNESKEMGIIEDEFFESIATKLNRVILS